MKGQMHILRSSDSTPITIQLDAPPELEALKKAVGGYIEKVPMFDTWGGAPCVCLCNEEGKLHHLPLNQHATERRSASPKNAP